MKKTVPLAKLIRDWRIYPRVDIDGSHVANLRRSYERGDKIPLPVVDQKSLRIVDGWHRCKAQEQVLGPAGQVEVELVGYASEAELLTDAIRRNATHGRALNQSDRTRCILLLEECEVPVEEIAVTLHTTEQRVEELRIRVVNVDHGDGKPETIQVKPNAWPRHGEEPRTVTPEQAEVLRSSNGWRTSQTVGQLTRELRSGAVDASGDPDLAAALWELAGVIGDMVPKPTASAVA